MGRISPGIQITASFACLFVLFAARAQAADPVPPAENDVNSPSQSHVEGSVQGKSLAERMWAQSSGWLGRPYRHSPLGEGTVPDADPRAREDAFDCVTLVESAIAAACTGQLTVDTMDAIRYRGAPSFESRRHLTEFQWLPDLVGQGLLRPVAVIQSGQDVLRATSRIYSLKSSQFRTPIGAALAHSGLKPFELSLQLPTFDIADLPADAGEPVRVAILLVDDGHLGVTRAKHMGLLFKQQGKLVLRHASSLSKRVIDERWARIVRRQQGHPRGVRHVALYDLVGCPEVGK